MTNYCIQNLNEIRTLLKILTDEQYQFKSEILTETSIGQHTRHILEFYSCLIKGVKTGVVNYDRRERNLQVEDHTQSAIKLIDAIICDLANFKDDVPLILEGNYDRFNNNDNQIISTTFYRELTYNLEHTIHHQALIKVGLKVLEIDHLIEENFGVAPATVRYKVLCK